MVFCGMFPSDGDQFEDLREALGKLQLNDAALSFEPEVCMENIATCCTFSQTCIRLRFLSALMVSPGLVAVRAAQSILAWRQSNKTCNNLTRLVPFAPVLQCLSRC